MKSHGGIFELICSLENLRGAMARAARGKRDRQPVMRFLENADRELDALRNELLGGTYKPCNYTQFRVMDPKPRTISCADFRDRVAHHAVCGIIGPFLERRFIADSYACRVGKGTHRAVLRAQHYARRYRYFAKLDVRGFFDSVDHDVLLSVLDRLFRERRLRELLEVIVRHQVPGQDAGKGLPIGNLTSQWFANLYLDGVDHMVKDEWGVGGYVRYMDDMVLWADRKASLWQRVDCLENWLACERQLSLKDEARVLAPCTEGIPFLGMRVFPGKLRLQRGRWRRARRLVSRREKEFMHGVISGEQLAASLTSVCGGAGFFGLRNVVHTEVCL